MNNKTKPKKTILFSIIIIILIFTLFSGCIRETDDKNLPINDFTFTNIDGQTKRLSDFLGKVVLLDLWAAWCGPCQMQMFELLDAYNYYPKEEFEILSINVDAGENLVQIQQFIDEYKRYGYDLEWVFGNDDDGSIWESYKVGRGGIPAIVIFDKKGEIFFAHEGIAVFKEIPDGLPANTPKLSLIINQLL